MADQDEIIESPFSSDSEGFLTGPRINASELRTEFGKINTTLTGMARSVTAIERALKVQGVRRMASAETLTVAGPRISVGTTTREQTVRRKSEAVVIAEPAREAAKTTRSSETAGSKETPKRAVENLNRARQNPVPVNAQKAVTVKKSAFDVVTAPKTTPKTAEKDNQAITKPAEPHGRDEKGRFVAQSKLASNGQTSGLEGYESDRAAENLAGKLADAVRDSSEDMRQSDPVVAAVSEIAEPVSHAVGSVEKLWESDREAGLLKRILNGFNKFRKEQSTFNKAEKKALGDIADNTDKIGAGGAAAETGDKLSIFAGLGKKAGAAAGAVGAGARKVLRKIPVLGSLFALGKGAFDVANSELDTRKTREEKDRTTGSALGDAAGVIGGGIAGGKLGALAGTFLGPVGTIIGGAVGSAAGMFFGSKAGRIVGETVGGWVADLRRMDIGGAIVSRWNKCVDSVGDVWNSSVDTITGAWTSVTERVSSAWIGLTDTLSSAWSGMIEGVSGFWAKAKESAATQLKGINDWIKDKTGIDAAGTASTVANVVTGAVKSTVGMVKEVFGAREKTPSWNLGNSGQLFDLGVERQSKKIDPKTWQLGDSSAAFESGGRGASTISRGFGDLGGKSYGTYQLASNTGTLQAFLDQSGYGEKLNGLRPGSWEFDRQWKRLADTDPEFAKAQHDFVKRTHYDKAMGGLADAGIDLSKRGKAVQDAVWSTSVQFGAGSATSAAGAVPMIQKALTGRDVSSMSDEEIITALQDYKLANNARLFRGSSQSVREGTAKRAVLEKQRLVALARLEHPEAKSPTDKKEQKGPTIATAASREADSVKDVPESRAVEVSRVKTDLAADRSTYRYSKKAKTADIGAASIPGVNYGLQDGTAQALPQLQKAFGLPAEQNAVSTPLNINASRKEATLTVRGASTAAVSTAKPVVASTSVPVMPPGVNVPPPAKAVSVPMPLSGISSPAVPSVRIESEIGQDIKERGIAHIVTGGLA